MTVEAHHLISLFYVWFLTKGDSCSGFFVMISSCHRQEFVYFANIFQWHILVREWREDITCVHYNYNAEQTSNGAHPRSLSLGISRTMFYNLYAVKCNLTGFTTKSARIPVVGQQCGIHACTRIQCAPDWRHVCVLHGDGVFKEYCFCMGARLQVSPSLPSLFPLLIQCDECLSPLSACGLIVQFPGCLRHQTSDAVVN